MNTLTTVDQKLKKANDLALNQPNLSADASTLKVGVDLGTSSIVLVVVDQDDEPIYVGFKEANVIRDGLVVNYLEAVKIVKQLKQEAENSLHCELTHASGAIPPGTIGNNLKVVSNVIEAAEMEVVHIFDEPTAAANVLNVNNDVVVDVGGGTTGVSVFNQGEIVYSGDEASGGTQMTLVLSGYLGVPSAEGEKLKRDQTRESDNFEIIRPVIEKVATIAQNIIAQSHQKEIEQIYLVGGAVNFKRSPEVFEKLLGIPTIHPQYAQFVTPLGIAIGSY